MKYILTKAFWERSANSPASIIVDRTLLILIALFPYLLVIGASPAGIAMAICAAIFLPILLLRENLDIKSNRLFQLLIIIWLYLMAASLASPVPSTAFENAMIWIRFPLFGFAIWHVISNVKGAYKVIIFSLALLLFLVEIDLWIEFFNGKDLLGHGYDNRLGQYSNDSNALRLYGPYTRLTAGAFIVHYGFPVLALVWFMVLQSKKIQALIGASLLTSLHVAISFLVGSRMPFLLLMFGLAVLLPWLAMRKIGLSKTLIPMVVGVVMVLLTLSLLTSQSDRMAVDLYGLMTNFWATHWGGLMSDGIEVWRNYPITGVGIKNFRLLCDGLLPGAISGYAATNIEMCSIHPHNYLIEWFATAGIIGGGLYLVFLGFLAKTILPIGSEDTAISAIAKGASVSALIILWPIATTPSFYSSYLGSELWYIIGLALGFSALSRRFKA